MTEKLKGLPVKGYQDQPSAKVALVNHNKMTEEKLLREMDILFKATEGIDKRWLAIARTHFEQGFMAFNRSIFQPERINLPGDADASSNIQKD